MRVIWSGAIDIKTASDEDNRLTFTGSPVKEDSRNIMRSWWGEGDLI